MNTSTFKDVFSGLNPAEQYSLVKDLMDIIQNNPNFYEKRSGYVCTDSLDEQKHAQDKMAFVNKVKSVGGIIDSHTSENDPVSQTTLYRFRIPKETEFE